MGTFDLTESFVNLVGIQDERNPKLGLLKDLKKVNVVLMGFAESEGLMPDSLSVMHVCVDSTHLHPALLRHINSLDKTEAYKGQNISRFKKLVRHLPWSEQPSDADNVTAALIEEQLPPHLKQIWFLLPRTPSSRSNARRIPAEYPSNGEEHSNMPLTLNSISLGLALLRISKAHQISDSQTLLDDYSTYIYKDIRLNNPSPRWVSLRSVFTNLRMRVRNFLNYEVENRPNVTIKLGDLPEPLRTQVLVYKERAKNGFQVSRFIKKLGRKKYGLKFKPQSQVSINNCLNFICLGLGYIPRHLYGDSLDIKDLMKLTVREIEVDETKITEVYNVLIDPYRERELGRTSDYKDVDFDSQAFGLFVKAIATVAAYNGFFQLRKAFLNAYTGDYDTDTAKNRKRDMKRVFDRKWIDRQLENLKLKFHRILAEKSFRSNPDSILRREARDDLNLCLFYQVLLTLRFLGVRQRNIRESEDGTNVIVISRGRVTFQWLEEETKNKKGIIHRLTTEKHAETHADLIDAVWEYQRHIYPFISGARGDEDSPKLALKRQEAIQGRFYVKIGADGICVPFNSQSDFNRWFHRQSNKFLEFGEMLDENTKPPSPHFYRGLFGDWTHIDLKCTSETSAALAADSKETFEAFYLEPTSLFDATDTWTEINQKLKGQRQHGSGTKHNGRRAQPSKRADLEKIIKSQADTIEWLKAKLREKKGETSA